MEKFPKPDKKLPEKTGKVPNPTKIIPKEDLDPDWEMKTWLDMVTKVSEAQKNALNMKSQEVVEILRSVKKDPKKYLDNIFVVDKAKIWAENLYEFKLVLEILKIPKRRIQEYLAHENAHANKAEAIGGGFEGYSIYILKEGLMFSANTNVPANWPKEKKKQAWKEILFAPEEYGGELSDIDSKRLEDLK